MSSLLAGNTPASAEVEAVALAPTEQTLGARLRAYSLHAMVDSREHTEPAPRVARFEDEVDPDRTLPEQERRRRAEKAKRAYFTRLASKSAQARGLV